MKLYKRGIIKEFNHTRIESWQNTLYKYRIINEINSTNKDSWIE